LSLTAQQNSYPFAIQQARQALKQGNRRAARRWAERAASLNPEKEEPWLIIAALANPRASLEYLIHALEINPASQPARKGMHWAIQRYRSEVLPHKQFKNPEITANLHAEAQPRKRASFSSWLLILLVFLSGMLLWLGTSSSSFASNQVPNMLIVAQEWVNLITFTPTITQSSTATNTLTPSPTSTNTLTLTPSQTSTHTPTFTPSPTNTETPTTTPSPIPTETNTPIPTATQLTTEDQPDNPAEVYLPTGVKKGEIWIDVDLTNQQLRVYKGKNLLNTYIVSTGTWRTPTVTGQYRIYVKYLSADMAGPGYYLPNVPYVMYFYEGYGLHGTYWHNNFGTPMSHGCVNLRTDNAEWVYNMANIGTVVNIHY
jgi:lipoprotein-anchoring transpeptidase ErfK/SrfK